MNVVPFFVAYAQPAELEQPSEDAFHHTTMFTQAAAMFRVSFGDDWFNPAFAKRLTDFCLRVVRAVGIDLRGTLSSSTAGTLDRRDRIDQRHRLFAVMDVRAGVDERQRDPLAIAHNMPLRAIFAAIGGIRPGKRPPKTARTEQLSKIALSQSISSASPSSSNSRRQICSHTPSACQSRSRRQQVMPEPQPISCGKYSHGQPVRSTNRIPVKAWRSGTGGRPPLGLGFFAGNNRSIRDHNSSVSSGLAISRSSMNAKRLAYATAIPNRFC